MFDDNFINMLNNINSDNLDIEWSLLDNKNEDLPKKIDSDDIQYVYYSNLYIQDENYIYHLFGKTSTLYFFMEICSKDNNIKDSYGYITFSKTYDGIIKYGISNNILNIINPPTLFEHTKEYMKLYISKLA